MRSMANTSISFGLVNVPVKMYASTESHDVAFHQYHVHGDGSAPGRIEQVRRCKQCAAEVAYGDVTKGVERGDTVITVSGDELSAIEADSGKAFTVLRFVDADAINPLMLQASYWLEPDVKLGKTALEGYTLLRTVLAETGR
jgi:DNA end-binding protein Ku